MTRLTSLPPLVKWIVALGGLALVLWLLLRRKRPALPPPPPPAAALLSNSGEHETLAEQDLRLDREGVVDRPLYEALTEALDYNAASSVPYANNRLKVLRARVRRGEPLTVHVPGEAEPRLLRTEAEFDDWEQRWLPGADSR